MLKLERFNTKLGNMVGVADEKHLYLLLFDDFKKLPQFLSKLELISQSSINEGSCGPLSKIKSELDSYFKGNLREFKTPTMHIGTQFQKSTWERLDKIPYGNTLSYADLAKSIRAPQAHRAVANANGANKLVIVTPCHRVVASNRGVGGYSCGMDRKKFLLNLENSFHQAISGS